jgi:hypothetical protein
MSEEEKSVPEKERQRLKRVDVARSKLKTLKTADRNKLKKVIGAGIYKYFRDKNLDPKNLDDGLVTTTKKGKREPKISKFTKRFEQLELNDEDIVSLLSIMLSTTQLKNLKGVSPFTEGQQVTKSTYNEITRYLNQNATQAVGQTLRDTINFIVENPLKEVQSNFGKLGLAPPMPKAEEVGEEVLEKLQEQSGKRPAGKPEEEPEKDDTEERIKKMTNYDQLLLMRTQIGTSIARALERGENTDRLNKLVEVLDKRIQEVGGEEEFEVEVPPEADPTGFKKITTKKEVEEVEEIERETTSEKQERERQKPVSKYKVMLSKEEIEGLTSIINKLKTEKSLFDKLIRDNAHIQNQLQKNEYTQKVANTISNKERSKLANVIQFTTLTNNYLGRKSPMISVIDDAIKVVTGKTKREVEKQEPVLGTVVRGFGFTGASVTTEEEQQNSVDFFTKLRDSDSDDEAIKLITEFEAEGETEEMPEPSAPTTKASATTTTAAPTTTTVAPTTTTTAAPTTATVAPTTTTAVPTATTVAPTTTGVATSSVKLPEKLTDEGQTETSKGTQRPKFISPSRNIFQPSEQDIQADFDEWAIFDFVQPVNNYGVEGNFNNNPLKRMARVEEETIYRNAGIDLQPALSSVFTDREVDSNPTQLALDMLPPLMPDTSNQPRQVYNVSEYEVKSYDINNDRTAIEYQSPYDSMTPIVLTNDEIRRSVLYGRVP